MNQKIKVWCNDVFECEWDGINQALLYVISTIDERHEEDIIYLETSLACYKVKYTTHKTISADYVHEVKSAMLLLPDGKVEMLTYLIRD